MKRQRTIIFIGGLVLALSVSLPVPALASSLLSGYGGPGQGNQAILGSALVNGPRGGGGGGSGGAKGSSSSGGSEGSATGEGGSSSSSGTSAQETASGTTPTSSGTSGAATGAGGSHGSSGIGSGRTRHGETTRAAGATASFYPASERIAASEDSGTLGLSGTDLLYILLAVGALVFMGVLTMRLARSSPTGSASG